MKDYSLQIKIKNNFLLTMMKQHNITTAAELSRASAVDSNSIQAMLNLTSPAYSKNGDIKTSVINLCLFFNCLPKDIFPEQHLQKSLKVNKVFMEANAEDLVPMYARLGSQDPLDLLLEQEQEELEHNALAAAVSTLYESQQNVLKLRFGVGTDFDESHTFTQIGEIMERTPTRISQIQDKALEKMRRPALGLQKLR
jgi:RNA polymerase sigma factor (sigma-70 family)